MVDEIVYTFKFNTLPNISVLKEECKIWLSTVLNKFDKDRGYKAFSFFSVITKNWFIHETKKFIQQSQKEVQYTELSKELESLYSLSDESDYLILRERKEFWYQFRKEIDHWSKKDLKENEKRVLQAVIILLDNIEDIEILNKKAFYLYLREITGLSSKRVISVLNKFKKIYRNFVREWKDPTI